MNQEHFLLLFQIYKLGRSGDGNETFDEDVFSSSHPCLGRLVQL